MYSDILTRSLRLNHSIFSRISILTDFVENLCRFLHNGFFYIFIAIDRIARTTNEMNSGESNSYFRGRNFEESSSCSRIWTNGSTKRMRTSFQKCQLDLLHRCFKRTHKPNADEMYRLVQHTQLSKRVLQVSV